MMSRTVLRTLATLVLALAAAVAWRHWQLPLPWMIGPMLVTAAASMAGLPTDSWSPARNAGQWVIGAALGLYFTPEVGALVLQLWWAVLLAIVWALALGWGFGLWLQREAARLSLDTRAQRATSYFAGAIGGASEMTLLAERENARTDLVAAAHSLRILIITVGIPFAFAWADLHGVDATPPALRVVDWSRLPLLAGATLAGALVFRRLGWANPWFIGALVTAMGLTLAGLEWSALPLAVTNAAQLVIGISLGVRFRAEFVRIAPRWLAAVAVGTLAMIGVSAGLAVVLAWATGLHPATLVLATSPGGIAEMAITAKVLQLGVPVVTAFQVCRLVAVLLLVGPMYRWLYRRA